MKTLFLSVLLFSAPAFAKPPKCLRTIENLEKRLPGLKANIESGICPGRVINGRLGPSVRCPEEAINAWIRDYNEMVTERNSLIVSCRQELSEADKALLADKTNWPRFEDRSGSTAQDGGQRTR